MILNKFTDYRPRNPEHIKSTLDPDRLQASDAFILTNGLNTLPISFGNGSTETPLPAFSRHHPYRHPMNSFAFLYYHKPTGLPDTAGEIRIRLTPSPNPATFDQGHDLRRPSGGLWTIPLLKLVSHAEFDLLCQQLVHDRLVTPTLLSHCKKTHASPAAYQWDWTPTYPSLIVATFQDQFLSKPNQGYSHWTKFN